MGLFGAISDRLRQGSEVGDWCPEDELDDVHHLGGVQALVARPNVTNGRIQWDRALAGVPKVTYVAGWERRGNPVMTPVANLWHWTAGKPSTRRPAPSLNICINGRPDVPGPLVHGLVALDGTIHIICSGRANHAGMGHKALIVRMTGGLAPQGTAAALRFADTGGSSGYLCGWEVENDGKAPFSRAQVNSITNIAKATRHRLGFNVAQSIDWHHAAWTRRKIDITPGPRMAELHARAVASEP